MTTLFISASIDLVRPSLFLSVLHSPTSMSNLSGQKTLHLRTFSPIDGIEWVRAVAACKATVSPTRYLGLFTNLCRSCLNVLSQCSDAVNAMNNSNNNNNNNNNNDDPDPVRVVQSERVPHSATMSSPNSSPLTARHETMPSRVGASPLQSDIIARADHSEESEDDDRGTQNFEPPLRHYSGRNGRAPANTGGPAPVTNASPAAATTTAAGTAMMSSAVTAASPMASPRTPEHYHQVPTSPVAKLSVAANTTAPTTTTTSTTTSTATATPRVLPVATVTAEQMSAPVDFDGHTVKPWFRPDLTRVTATEFLERKAVGCFIIRLSSQNGCLCISHVEQAQGGGTFVGHGIIHQWRGPPPARYGWSIEQVQATYPTLEALLRSLPLVWETDGAYTSNGAATAATPAAAPASTPSAAATATTAANPYVGAPAAPVIAVAVAPPVFTGPRVASGLVQCEQVVRTGSWPAARRGHSLVPLGGWRALLVGGTGPSGRALSAAERMWVVTVNGASCSWEQHPLGSQLPALSDFGLCGDMSAALDARTDVVDGMFIFGGRRADGSASNELIYFSLLTGELDAIRQTEVVPPARHSHSFVMLSHSEALLIGGQTAQGELCKDMWLLDLHTCKWTELSLPFKPSPRFSQCGVVQDGVVSIIGGVGGAGQTLTPRADVWSFNLAPRPTWRLACGAAPFGERCGAAAVAVLFDGPSATGGGGDDDDDPLAALSAMAGTSDRGTSAPSVCLLVGGVPPAEYVDEDDALRERRVWLAKRADGPGASWEMNETAVPFERRSGSSLVCFRAGGALLFGGAIDSDHVVDDLYLFTIDATLAS
jgi:hypothetical protein